MTDWSEEWEKGHENLAWVRNLKEKGISSENFWDEYPDKLLEEYEECSNYPGPILERMMKFIDTNTTILDVGAGAGAYTIPFAQVAKKVTVVEPSKGQISRLMGKAERIGLNNIAVINKRWEDVKEEELERYDLVNAAYCFHMLDIKVALQKMLNMTRSFLSLVAFSDSNLMDVYQIILGKHDPGPDYITIYNVLHQIGIHANVEIIIREFFCPWDLTLKMLRYEYGTSQETEAMILKHLKQTDRILEEGGGILVKRRTKSAFVRYLKE